MSARRRIPWGASRQVACIILIGVTFAGAKPATAQDGPPPTVRAAVQSVVQMLESRAEAPLQAFIDNTLAPEYRATFEPAELTAHLDELRTLARGRTGGVSVERGGDGLLTMVLDDGVSFVLGIDDEGRVTRLEAGAAGPSGGREGAIMGHVRALESLAEAPPAEVLATLEADHLAPSYLSGTRRADRQTLVERISAAARDAGGFMLEEDERGIHLVMDRPNMATRVTFRVEDVEPHRVVALDVRDEAVRRLEWSGLAERFREAEADGFRGTVIGRRGGDVVLREAFGAADTASSRPATMETVYGIGSMPIDFTVTAALLFADRGEFDLDAPIGRYLGEVPADRAGMTARMIMNGRSGLPDFHGSADDWDQDLAWIDRDEAVRRMMAAPLLFEPGTEAAHSHSAYGLLAALLEIATGRSYDEIVRTELFDPAGMTRTGFYGETLGLDVDDFAVGYGASAVGLPNIPPNWGPTSWLVMGSGGMFSTADDLDRFYAAAEAGRFGAPAARRFGGVHAGAGGSDRGFFVFRTSNGRGDSVLLLMNSEGRADWSRALTRELHAMVSRD